MGSVNPGKRFEGRLKDSMEAAGIEVMRIPDKLYFNGHRILSEETPADFSAHAVIGGVLHAYLVEAKACSKNRLPFSNLQAHQAEALRRFDSLHGSAHGYVAVNFYDPVNLRRRNECYMVPISVWDEYEAGDFKSLAMSDCEGDPRVAHCPSAKGSVYDMSGFVGFGPA